MNSPEIIVGIMTAPAILADSRYEADEDNSSFLLSQTCNEPAARFHTLLLLRNYSSDQTFSSRKRKLLTDECLSLTDLYEATWCELASAFGARVVASTRTEIEGSYLQSASHICPPSRRQMILEFDAEFSDNNSDRASLASVNKEAAR